ncbi:hypothetical protein FF38_06022 [Lucilia cuprina]|uniref:Uncharacterized protein n=1 Tax=Lucilia cuprina TaxID=7375 RepID=A0A0L0CJ13_LUCCU|nr:hypothetical protein FF38_06022 [Lucilia cuprina]
MLLQLAKLNSNVFRSKMLLLLFLRRHCVKITTLCQIFLWIMFLNKLHSLERIKRKNPREMHTMEHYLESQKIYNKKSNNVEHTVINETLNKRSLSMDLTSPSAHMRVFDSKKEKTNTSTHSQYLAIVTTKPGWQTLNGKTDILVRFSAGKSFLGLDEKVGEPKFSFK